jgi:DNA-binding transcriptional LysR family regulator
MSNGENLEVNISHKTALMFDLSQLRCFVTVVEEMHFGRAATRLNMTQPPLSRQIQVLERILDAPLLERTSRSMRLTPAGRSFLPEARRILKLSDNAALVAKRIAAGRAGALKIGYTAAGAYSFMPELVKAVRKLLPDVDFSLREMVTGDQFDDLGSGQLDVGLLRPPIMRPELDFCRVVAETLIAAIPADHPLAAQSSIKLRDLDGQPFVMYAPYESRYFYDLVVAAFVQAKVLPNYVQHVSQIHSVLSLVRAGFGFGIVPEAAMNLHMEGVVLRSISDMPQRRVELYMVWRKDGDNPLLPSIIQVARDLANAKA